MVSCSSIRWGDTPTLSGGGSASTRAHPGLPAPRVIDAIRPDFELPGRAGEPGEPGGGRQRVA
ncbi:hypothetical protein FXF51_21875 [Nonomuraea sp. PA05]|uniref:hypothetical protein n=1 Tax=Nonomuraea sp. PA05 TaxID=2604466 RepID=UPI0011DA5BBA|nr:hypothetical protein [Nonomuraea sp. PA05]TYB64367.1 hypothetical protein FXF51_21875 [Nonomuraea sp. PA05]